MFSAAAEQADERQARLRAERAAEYNRFLEKKNAEKPQVYNKQKSNNAMAMSPQAPESYYGNERSPEGFGPTAKAPLDDRQAKIQKQRQYHAELQQQAKSAADRKRQEREQELAESREMLMRQGELSPTVAGAYDYRPAIVYAQEPIAGATWQEQDVLWSRYGRQAAELSGPPPHDWAPPTEDPGNGFAQFSPARRGPGPVPEAPGRYVPPRGGFQEGPPAAGPREYAQGGGGRGAYVDQPPDYEDGPSPSHLPRGAPQGDGYGGFHKHPQAPKHYQHPPPYPPLPYQGGVQLSPGAMGQGGKPFAESQAVTRSFEAQRKAAYRAELEKQMVAVAERKAAEKRKEKEFDERLERQAADSGYQVWGNRGGGGGDPLRDDAGNVISDLNKVRHYTHTNRPGGAGKRAGAPPPPEEAGGSYDYGDDPLYPPAPSQAGGVAMLMPPGGHTVYHQDTAVQPIGNFRSDNAYMLPHELEAKARQRKQMQDALQQQIEEKRRKKEEETRREKEEERKETERLAREQEQLKAAFESEAMGKKAKAAQEAENMRKLAEEAYVKAQSRKQQRSAVGEYDEELTAGERPRRASDDGTVLRSGRGAPLPPALPHHASDFYQEDTEPRQIREHRSSHGGSRPLSSRSSRTAEQISRLKDEMLANQARMRQQVEQRLYEATERQEMELRELRRRAEAAEAEVADIRKAVKRVPSFGRRASRSPPGDYDERSGRRRWDVSQADTTIYSNTQTLAHTPAQERDADQYMEYGDATGNNRLSQEGRLRPPFNPTLSSMDLDASLRGNSQLIFPGQEIQGMSSHVPDEFSISSLKPLPVRGDAPATLGRHPGRSSSAGRRPRSRLGTPLEPNSIPAKNQDCAKLLDDRDKRTQDVGPISPAQSDALDDLLLKFVELDKPAASGPAAAVLNSSIDMSLRGDSEWIEARP